MNSRIIVDTEPIVGLIRKDDQWSRWAHEQARELSTPYLTCEAVINEASFLLQSFRSGGENLLEMIELGVLQIEFSLSYEVAAVRSLMKKYADVPMSLADACLVRMSELVENSLVYTVDSDFLFYRRTGRKKIPLIYPN